MEKVKYELVLFLLSFIFVFVLYRIFIVRRAKKIKNPKEPFEVSYLVSRYKFDMKRINYDKLLTVISIVSSFDIALIVFIIVLLDNFILEVIVGFISTLVIIISSYHLVYLVYKKKGMIENESKRNRK